MRIRSIRPRSFFSSPPEKWWEWKTFSFPIGWNGNFSGENSLFKLQGGIFTNGDLRYRTFFITYPFEKTGAWLTLPETNQQFAPENRPKRPKKEMSTVFQPSIFRGKLLVSGRVNESEVWWFLVLSMPTSKKKWTCWKPKSFTCWFKIKFLYQMLQEMNSRIWGASFQIIFPFEVKIDQETIEIIGYLCVQLHIHFSHPITTHKIR